MAERRMFAKTIIDSDVFLDMPLTAQALYFHLCMRADDDGFINNPKSIMRNVKCGDDDIKLLVSKKFIIPFETGVIVIRHWKLHNYIRNDRYKQTECKDELKSLKLDENKVYILGIPSDNQMDTIGIPSDNQMDTIGIPNDNQMDTEVGLCDELKSLKLDKNKVCTLGIPSDNQMDTQVRLGKVSIDKYNNNNINNNINNNKDILFVVVTMLDNKITLEEASMIFKDSEGDMNIIKQVYDYSKTQEVNNLVGFMRRLVRPGVFNKVIENKASGFNNFPSREYDYDELERKLLGWDK